MERELSLEILRNFKEDFQEFAAFKTGRMKEFFDLLKIKPRKFKTDKMTGFGKITNNNQVNGKTIVHYQNGNCYIGEFKNNKRGGVGLNKFPNNAFYEGKYENDKKVEGKVVNLENLALIYEGGWGNDVYHNKGKLNRVNGIKYEGEFLFGELHGLGRMSWPNGDIYHGDFMRNKREGTGTLEKSNGDMYKG